MVEKNPQERIDTFDYDTINEDSITNEKIDKKVFRLNKVETLRYEQFRKNHANCRISSNGRSKFGCSGGGFSITFYPTGLGSNVICRCEGCKSYADITDFDSW